jgi:hypothetical protein
MKPSTFPATLKIPGIESGYTVSLQDSFVEPDQESLNPVIQEKSQPGDAHAAGAEPPGA